MFNLDGVATACPVCRRRSALVAALAPAIARLSFTRAGLLDMLALPNAQLLRAAGVQDPRGLWRDVRPAVATARVPTALCRHDPGYPETLAQLDCAPAVLYGTCTTRRLRELLCEPAVAIVGSRAPTGYARRIAATLAHDLAAAGVTVISGMNTGLEGAAHHGALAARGRSIAVMPAGPEIPYPSRQESLHRAILARGAAISELPPGFSPARGWCFIASQRIIAALARMTVIVEAGEHSCALFATRIAADLGADVAVVPGRVTDPGGRWTCALLRDGAHPVADARDVLELLGDRTALDRIAPG